jgi:hypothetical protein
LANARLSLPFSLDWRALGLSAVLALAAALPFLATVPARRDYYRFEVTLTAESAGATRLAWSDGAAFTPENSSVQPLRATAKPARYGYLLPAGRPRELRLAPSTTANRLTLRQARLLDRRGRVRHEFAVQDFRAVGDAIGLTVRGDTLEVDVRASAPPAEIALPLPPGFELPLTADVYWTAGWPMAAGVFLFGGALGVLGGWSFVHAALARVLRGAQQRPRTTLWLTAALAVAIQCHPVILLGRSFAAPTNGGLMLYGELPTLPGSREATYRNTMGSDVGAFLFQHLYYPMVQREALRHGELPVWNRFSLGGAPLLGQGQSMLGDPANLLTIAANGAAWAWDVRFVFARGLFAAGLGLAVWLLTRHLGAAALVTAAAPFIGFFGYRLLHPENFTLGYAPWVLVAWLAWRDAATRRDFLRACAGLVATNWLLLASGTVKEAYLQAVVLNLAGLAVAGVTRGRRPSSRLLGWTALALVGGVLLAAPLWLTFLATLRGAETASDHAAAQSLPWAQLAGLFDDIFYRQSSPGNYVVAPALNVLFLLGVLAWLCDRFAWREDRGGRALALLSLCGALVVFGLVPERWITALPFIGRIGHVHTTVSSILVILLGVLAGAGFARRLRGEKLPRLGAAVGGAVFLVLLGSRVAAPDNAGFPLGHGAALALAGLAGWGLLARAPRSLPLVCVALGIGGPLLMWRHAQAARSEFDAFVFVPGAREDVHAAGPAMSALPRAEAEPGRIAGWNYTLFTSHQIAFGREGIFGVDALRSREFLELTRQFRLAPATDWEKPLAAANFAALRPALDFLNVALHAFPPDAAPGDAPALRRVATADLAVWGSDTAWPRAFFTNHVHSYRDPAHFAALLADTPGPFAALRDGEAAAPLALERAEPKIVRATDYRLTPNRTAFTIEASGPGLAVLQETFWPAMITATVDGREVAPLRVNHAFTGVPITAPGRHRIEIHYRPRSLVPAGQLALLGALLLGAGAWAYARYGAAPR